MQPQWADQVAWAKDNEGDSRLKRKNQQGFVVVLVSNLTEEEKAKMVRIL